MHNIQPVDIAEPRLVVPHHTAQMAGIIEGVHHVPARRDVQWYTRFPVRPVHFAPAIRRHDARGYNDVPAPEDRDRNAVQIARSGVVMQPDFRMNDALSKALRFRVHPVEDRLVR